MPCPHPTWIEIDAEQLERNLRCIKKWVGGAKYCLPVKANGYGHGLVEVGRVAERVGVDYLGVAHLSEGVRLREAGVKVPILVLGAIHEDQIDAFGEYRLEFTISSQYKAELVERRRPRGKCRVHLEVDTGMRRTGVRPETAKLLGRYLCFEAKSFELVGVYSHFASAGGPNDPIGRGQLASFEELMKEPVFKREGLLFHLCNSGGVAFFPEAHLGMVRPGLMSYGYPPAQAPDGLKEIAPCFSLKTKVSYFKVVKGGEGIGYGHTYKTAKETRIVTLPIGYGDGFRRALSNRGSVLIRGRRFPIVGIICMDQLMVDVGEAEVYVGDEAVLIGKQGEEEISLKEVADLCQTVPYEILCSLNERIPRIVGRKNLKLSHSEEPAIVGTHCSENHGIL